MAGYCRYCNEKTSDPRDPFCYSCRKPGMPVDYFYRFAKKVDLDEDDIDWIRYGGKGLVLMALVGALFPAFLLTFALMVNAGDPVERDRAPDWMIAILIVILIILLLYLIVGIGLMRLDKRFVDRKWKIAIIMLFFWLSSGMNAGRACRERDHALKIAFTHFATGEKPVKRIEESAKPLPGWKCRFCGYENGKASFACKSCGKEKGTRLG